VDAKGSACMYFGAAGSSNAEEAYLLDAVDGTMRRSLITQCRNIGSPKIR